MAVEDYEVGAEIPQVVTQSPEQVELENKLGRLYTRIEEVLNRDEMFFSSDRFIEERGQVLDMLDDVVLTRWIDKMRAENRVPFRRYPVSV